MGCKNRCCTDGIFSICTVDYEHGETYKDCKFGEVRRDNTRFCRFYRAEFGGHCDLHEAHVQKRNEDSGVKCEFGI